MSRFSLCLIAGVAAISMLGPTSASSQSLFARGGLGIQIDPLDARSKSLGSVGVGLFGVSLTTIDPTAGFQSIPSLAVTLQPSWGTFETPSQSGELQGQRFPILGVSYPVRTRGMVSVTYGTFMDQRWAVSAPDTLELAGRETEIIDSFESNGGISSFRIGYAHRVATGLVLGVNLGALTGQVTRTFGRAFDSTVVDVGVDDFDVSGRWRWLGPAAAVAARWDPNELIRISGSLNWYGTLEAQPQDSTPGGTVKFDLPLEFRTGANLRLTPEVALNAGFSYGDWTSVTAAVTDTVDLSDQGTTAMAFGGGVEWSGVGIAGKSFPLRLGYRRQDLPFKFEGDKVIENSFSAGLGLNLAQTEGIVLAKMDLALERATRSAPMLTERFWRFSLSFQATGL